MLDRCHILVADDADSLLLSIIDILRLEGYECNYVPDTKTAIEILKCIKFDIVIVGINTVGSRASEIIKELTDNAKNLSVILVADASLSDAQMQSVKPFVAASLSKPLCIEELLKHVRCLIKGKLIGT